MDYKNAIRGEVEKWVAENFEEWKDDPEPWFKLEKIPIDYLPATKKNGGARRDSAADVEIDLEKIQQLMMGNTNRSKSTRGTSRVKPENETVKQVS